MKLVEFIVNTLLGLLLLFARWVVGFAIITFLIDGAFTFADIVVIAIIIGQVAYFYYDDYYKKK